MHFHHDSAKGITRREFYTPIIPCDYYDDRGDRYFFQWPPEAIAKVNDLISKGMQFNEAINTVGRELKGELGCRIP